ncbi:MAG: PilW family protein [Hahellaceae bacterium]|nr:PilW family protein [Hahellaceae bacterium]
MYRMFKFKLPGRQWGLSLIELMVALVVSLILLGGLVQLVVTNKQTYNFQQSQALNQENSRYSFFYLETILNKAGYRAAPQDGIDVVFGQASADANCSAFVKGQVVASSLAGTGACIRYQRAASGELDCAGAAVAAATPFVTRVYYNSAGKSLMCGAQGATAVALVENVEGVQVSYGIDTGSSNLSFVSTPSDWTDVRAIRFAVLTASESQVLDAPQNYTFPLMAATATTAADRRAYRSTMKTVQIRNAIVN